MRKEERLKNLDNEKFYFIMFDGTLMPNKPKYVKITMFNNVFYIEDENGLKEYIDIYFILQVQQFLTRNIAMLDKITNTNQYIKSSYNHEISIKINGKKYNIDRNASDDEGRKIYDYFKQQIFQILGIKDDNV